LGHGAWPRGERSAFDARELGDQPRFSAEISAIVADMTTRGESMTSALAEASALIDKIGGCRGTKKERRMQAFVKLQKSFTWNRIVDLHKGERRAVPSAEEMARLRAVAKEEHETSSEYVELVKRIERLEALISTLGQNDHCTRDGHERQAFFGVS
jgi:hypothetical protein